MTKRQALDLIIPAVSVLMLFFGGWCSYKKRFTLLMFTIMVWVLFGAWMVFTSK